MKYFGIDGCKTGWVVWSLEGDRPFMKLVHNLSNIESELEQGIAMIDIPIGFSDEKNPDRPCDKAARKFLSPKRGSSVFPVPCREAAYAEDYQQACLINLNTVGKKLSKQTWYILPKVREVDALLAKNTKIQLRESHPEVVFKALQGEHLAFSKKILDGQQERMEIIARYKPDWIPTLKAALESTKKSYAAADDLIDALALLLVAINSTQLTSLPGKHESIAADTSQEIIYWQPE
ncbi:DUF429 domain-containing protein [Vibrio maerlii]|uniref:DUF429 domain-containing protein n=1 Tax=Vibrio maerlii TaxID=2231648 RepID=UPI0013DF0E9C|nr:DUF429 domain-containing protein [Vibrio maerlii]